MAKVMSEHEIKDWEAKQANGSFSYILEQGLLWTPLFLIPRAVFYYFLEDKQFSIGILLEWTIVSFLTSLGVCAVSWYSQQSLYKNSISQKTEKNQ